MARCSPVLVFGEPLTNLDISNIAVHGRSAEDEDRGELCSALAKTLPTVQLIEAHEAMQGTPWQGPSRLQALERGVHGIGNPETRPSRSVAGAPMRPLLYPPLRCVSLGSISVALSLSLHIDNVVQADWEDVSERDPMLGRSLQVDGPQSKMVQ
ncbi:hypothetical protein CLIM01_07462 [Colletotrichum limetticola]|uniref:Uncharacterized protein n=1 Tax=Colletotrichum limetticola TaxID=1209924 RepID=A0ABQ9PUH6_9PEZI|nr:hypothetical protein CLIM01_07462 [Colletotrichum limetticola]